MQRSKINRSETKGEQGKNRDVTLIEMKGNEVDATRGEMTSHEMIRDEVERDETTQRK